MRHFQALAAFALAATLSASASADVITDWNSTAIAAARSFANPNPATYSIVVAHLAAYDAVNAIHPTGAKYLSDAAALGANGTESVDAAAAQAFHDVLAQLIVAKKADIDAALVASLAAVPDGDAKTKGIAVGAAAAAAILEARKADVINPSPAPDPFVGEDALGKWRPTPREVVANPPLPGNTPWWVDLEPFAIASNDAYDPGPPPALSSARYAADYLEVKQYGSSTGSVRSVDQTNIARFWAQQTHVPYNAIARTLSLREKLSTDDNARLFALLNLALADSRISVWQAKYEYAAWRPITAINFQGDDGNPDTSPAVTNWVPLLETPNHPEYPSGHSGTGAAGAGVLAFWFGDQVSFSVGSDTAAGYTRSFTKLSDSAQENANSRIYGGIHFRYANEAGIKLGQQIAKHVTKTFLKANEPPVPSEGGAGGVGAGGEPNESEAGAGPVEPTAGAAGADSGGTAATRGSATAGSNATGGSSATAGSGGKAGNHEEEPGEGGAPTTGNGGSSSGAAGSSDSGDDSGCSLGQGSTNSGMASALLAALGLAAAVRRRRQR